MFYLKYLGKVFYLIKLNGKNNYLNIEYRMTKYFIYKISSLTTDKYYIGQTCNIQSRWSLHLLKMPNCSSHKIWEYSEDDSDVIMDIIAETGSQENADNLEKMYILKGKEEGLCVNVKIPLGTDETADERQKKNMKLWLDNNRPKWNAYMRERNIKKKQEILAIEKENADLKTENEKLRLFIAENIIKS